jgi:hypothetical protein
LPPPRADEAAGADDEAGVMAPVGHIQREQMEPLRTAMRPLRSVAPVVPDGARGPRGRLRRTTRPHAHEAGPGRPQ